MRIRPAPPIAALLVAVALLVAACGQSTGDEVSSDAARAPEQPGAANGTVAAITAFGADLYRALTPRNANFVISPYAIAQGLATTRVGAAGDTATQLDTVLHADRARRYGLDAGFNAIGLALDGRSGDRQSDLRKGKVDVELASAAWAQQGNRFRDQYLTTLAQYYGTGIRVVDFRSDPEAARKAVNGWVSDETRGHINELVPRGTLTQATRYLLTSALYLRAPWQIGFRAEQTRLLPFHLLDGQTVTTPTLVGREPKAYSYGKGDGWEAVGLPYLGGQLDMVVVLPAAGTLPEFEASLDGDRLQAILRSLSFTPLEVQLPKFQFTTEADLDEPLTALGMPAAFSPTDADLSGITADEPLWIADDLHQAYISVDEEGTEASAATVVSSRPPPSFAATTVAIDRPFLFLVRDHDTGALLDLGRVLNPRG